MFNYLELLERVLLVPQKVYNTGNEELWSKFEEEVGIIFPNDYKKLIGRYGTGGIGNFIWFLTPFSADRNVNYIERMNIMLEAYQISKSKLPEYFIHNVYPDKGGLLPWGYTENGDELYWKTDESLDNWEIIIYESASPDYCCYKMSLTEFLYKIITGKLVCDIFPSNLFKEEMAYIAINTKGWI